MAPMATTTASKELKASQSKASRVEKPLNVSISADHQRILRQRAFDLSISCTALLRILLEVELRDGIARRELIARLNQGDQHLSTLV